MIKKSITLKLFFIILLIFMLQLVLQQVFQQFFIDAYYEHQKINELSEQFDGLIDDFQKTPHLEEQMALVDVYVSETNEPLMMINEYYEYHPAVYANAFEHIIYVDVKGELYPLPILEELGDEEFFDKMLNLIGDNCTLLGYWDSNRFIPYGVEIGGDVFYSYLFDEEIFDELRFDMDELSSYVVDFEVSRIGNALLQKTNYLLDYYVQITYDIPLEEDLNQYQVLTKDFDLDGETYTALTMVSLQPINEVAAIQGQFQWLLFTGMFVIIVIVAIFFSRTVSRPITIVTAAAQSIAKLDFETQCDETRSDEIGILGRSINQLSTALKSKIEAMEVMNSKLEDEVAFERRQDSIRKAFVANVSHELKTPLGIIRSYSEGIKDSDSHAKSSEYLEVIIEETKRMNYLVSNMLELSDLDAGHRQLKRERINLKRMVTNMLRGYEDFINQEELLVQVEMEDTPVSVDIRQFESVLSNLLSNAFRYVDEKKHITIRLRDKNLRIINSSETLTDAEIKQLWNRFYRVEQSRSRILGGNGLGLAITKEILDRHGFNYEIMQDQGYFTFIIDLSIEE